MAPIRTRAIGLSATLTASAPIALAWIAPSICAGFAPEERTWSPSLLRHVHVVDKRGVVVGPGGPATGTAACESRVGSANCKRDSVAPARATSFLMRACCERSQRRAVDRCPVQLEVSRWAKRPSPAHFFVRSGRSSFVREWLLVRDARASLRARGGSAIGRRLLIAAQA